MYSGWTFRPHPIRCDLAVGSLVVTAYRVHTFGLLSSVEGADFVEAVVCATAGVGVEPPETHSCVYIWNFGL